MATDPTLLSCEIEVRPGEPLRLPQSFTEQVGPGHWLVTIHPANEPTTPTTIRSHSAFLGSYAAEDEGLYDDYPTG